MWSATETHFRTTTVFNHVSDFDNVSKVLFPILFSDDTNVFVNEKDIAALMVIMNKELDTLCHTLYLAFQLINCLSVFKYLENTLYVLTLKNVIKRSKILMMCR